MNTTRKIAVAAATAALSLGFLGALAPAAHAKAPKDGTWGYSVTVPTTTTTTTPVTAGPVKLK